MARITCSRCGNVYEDDWKESQVNPHSSFRVSGCPTCAYKNNKDLEDNKRW